MSQPPTTPSNDNQLAIAAESLLLHNAISRGGQKLSPQRFDELWPRIKALPSSMHQLELIRELSNQFEITLDPHVERAALLADFIDSEDFQDKLKTEDTTFIADELKSLYELRKIHQQKGEELEKVFVRIDKRWPNTEWRRIFISEDSKLNFAKALAVLADRYTLEDTMNLVNRACTMRLAMIFKGRGAGVSNSLAITSDDLTLARLADTHNVTLPEPTTSFMNASFIQFDEQSGLIKPAQAAITTLPPTQRMKTIKDNDLRSEIENMVAVRLSLKNRPVPSTSDQRQKRDKSQTVTEDDLKALKQREHEATGGTDDIEMPDAEPEETPNQRPVTPRHRRARSNVVSPRSGSVDNLESYPYEIGSMASGVPARFAKHVIQGSIEQLNQLKREVKGLKCRCPADLKKQLNRPASSDWKEVFKMFHQVKTTFPGRLRDQLCGPHLWLFAHHLHLKSIGVEDSELENRIDHVWKNRASLGDLLSDHRTHSWFLAQYRPPLGRDALGPARYFAENEAVLPAELDRLKIYQRVCGFMPEDATKNYLNWEESGVDSTHLVATWLKDPQLQAALTYEMNAYEHHARDHNGVLVMGLHSLISQALAMDPLLWMWTFAHSSGRDRSVMMVGWPLPPLVLRNSQVYDLGIHENVAALAKDQGTGILHTLVELSPSTDEEEGDGPVNFYKGFHKHFDDWWRASGNTIANARETLASEEGCLNAGEAAELMGVEEESVETTNKAIPNEICVTTFDPRMPYGIEPRTTETLRFVQHRLVRVYPDSDGLPYETEAGISAAELVYCHQIKSPPPEPKKKQLFQDPESIWTPNNYIPTLNGPYPVCKALIGQAPWSDPAVVNNALSWLTARPDEMDKHYNTFKSKIVKNLLSSHDEFKKYEKSRYKEKSYAHYLETQAAAPPDDHLTKVGESNVKRLNKWGAALKKSEPLKTPALSRAVLARPEGSGSADTRMSG